MTAYQKKKNAKIKKHSFRNILSTLLMVTALGALFYPIVANYLTSRQTVQSVQNYNQEISSLDKKEEDQLLSAAKVYNDYIYDMSQHIPWTQEKPNYNQVLRTDDMGMMGYITIPQIQVSHIPIYHGDSEQTLAEGVGHMEQTSLPIGGLNTHAVLSAHSGRVNDTLFTHLDKLKNNDVFYIHTLNLELKYQIVDIKIVNPDQVSSLNIVKGEDLTTLITCYPTGINNKRLLVTGKRLPLKQKVPQEKIDRNQFGYNFWVFLLSVLLALLALLYLLYRLLLSHQRLYQVAITPLKEPVLADGQDSGDFGAGFYLTNSKALASVWAQQLVQDKTDEPLLNVYRLRKIRSLSRRIFKAKSENWKDYVAANHGRGYEGKEYALIIGPVPNETYWRGKKVIQYTLKSDEALKHLNYIKTIHIKTNNIKINKIKDLKKSRF